MTRTLVFTVAVAIVATAACGKSEEQKKAEEAAKQTQAAAQQIAQGAQQAAQGAQQAAQAGGNQLAQGLQQMAAGLQQMGKSGAKPVDYELLKGLMPDVSGWTRSDVRGEQQSAMGVSVSSARTSYRKDESRVDLVVTDTTFSQLLIAPMSMMLAAGFEERNDDGYKKAVTIKSYPGYEEWNKRTKRGEVTALVANRFMVQATGHDMDGIDSVRKTLESIDLARLAGLK